MEHIRWDKKWKVWIQLLDVPPDLINFFSTYPDYTGELGKKRYY